MTAFKKKRKFEVNKDSHLLNIVKEILKDNDISVIQLSDIWGMHVTNTYRILNGKVRLTSLDVDKLINHFGYTICLLKVSL